MLLPYSFTVVRREIRQVRQVFYHVMLLNISVIIFAGSASAQFARITVEAGRHRRIDVPVSLSLMELSGQLPRTFALEEVEGSKRYPVAHQFDPVESGRICWIVHGTLKPGEKKVYEVVDKPTVFAKFSTVKTEQNESFLEITTGRHKVLRYNHAVVPPPAGKSKLYSRSGFIHPLWSPAGSVLTAMHPEDHIHHMGIWMPWTRTGFEGRGVDFWNLAEGQGTVRFVKYLSTTSGPVFGGFRAEQEHVVLDANNGDKVALDEIWDVRVYNVGGPEKDYWLWDFVSTQRCASDSPLYQFKYRYGGLGFRATTEWEGNNCDYLTSEGKTKIDGHATRARWCDMYGLLEGKYKGVTVMGHPRNFRHPEPMRLWPGDMEFIFFNFCPSQIDNWKMEPGQDYVFRYRFYVHEGKLDVEQAERLWYDFAEPPTVKVQKF